MTRYLSPYPFWTSLSLGACIDFLAKVEEVVGLVEIEGK